MNIPILASLSLTILPPLAYGDEEQVLMGRIADENGSPVFLLTAPLKVGEQTVEKLYLSNPEAVVDFSSGTGSKQTVYLSGSIAPDSGGGKLAVTKVMRPPPPATTSTRDIFANLASWTSQTANHTTNTSIQIHQNTTNLVIPSDANQLETTDNADLTGRWTRSKDSGSVTVNPVAPVGIGGSFGNQIVVDLAENRKAAITISAYAPLGIEEGGTILGTWQTGVINGKPVLIIDVREYSGSATPFGDNFPKRIRWWIKHVGAGTLILSEDSGYEIQLAK